MLYAVYSVTPTSADLGFCNCMCCSGGSGPPCADGGDADANGLCDCRPLQDPQFDTDCEDECPTICTFALVTADPPCAVESVGGDAQLSGYCVDGDWPGPGPAPSLASGFAEASTPTDKEPDGTDPEVPAPAPAPAPSPTLVDKAECDDVNESSAQATGRPLFQSSEDDCELCGDPECPEPTPRECCTFEPECSACCHQLCCVIIGTRCVEESGNVCNCGLR